MTKFKHFRNLLPGLFLSIFYFATHLYKLDALPVFADEAIYIRWAQLILDDPGRYLFFAMNDGKTPAFIWLMVPFLKFLSDPLVAGRVTSVLVGTLQLPVTYSILRELKVKRWLAYLGVLLVTILPFWYFHHRMALMDGLLTLGLSVALLGSLLIVDKKKRQLRDVLVLAAGLGLAFWAKLPAVLALPALFAPLVLMNSQEKKEIWRAGKKIAIGTAGGLVIFGLLAFTPMFGQLFSRGGDFLYPAREVVFQGKWRETIISFPNYFRYFTSYLTLSGFFTVVVGLFVPYRKRRLLMLIAGGLFFFLPIAILGKVVYARYLFPVSLWFTLAIAVALDSIYSHYLAGKSEKQTDFRKKILVALVIAVLLSNTITQSFSFIIPSYFDVSALPFVSSDKEQYLTTWSSGHGIKEVADYVKELSTSESVAVATEGYFGTLPDGLLMYFHNGYPNVKIDGIGQPVEAIPASFVTVSSDYQRSFLLVNSDRLSLELPRELLVAQYCRPFGAPCLQLWDITRH